MILVVGATGELGGRIVRGLVAGGHPVRGLARDTAGSERLRRDGAQVVLGDLRRRDTITRAVRGIRAVVSTANAAARSGLDTIDAVDGGGTRALIDAAAEEGVRRFVYVSALGAAPDSPVPLMRAKAAAESRLAERSVPATILRPDLFMESWVGGFVVRPVRAGRPVSIVGAGERRHSFVAAADVAAFAIAAVEAADALGTLEIGGPEALSWLDVVERAATIVGRVIPVRHVSAGSSLPGMPDTVAQLAAALDAYDSVIDTEPLADRLGVELTPVDEWLRVQLTQ